MIKKLICLIWGHNWNYGFNFFTCSRERYCKRCGKWQLGGKAKWTNLPELSRGKISNGTAAMERIAPDRYKDTAERMARGE